MKEQTHRKTDTNTDTEREKQRERGSESIVEMTIDQALSSYTTRPLLESHKRQRQSIGKGLAYPPGAKGRSGAFSKVSVVCRWSVSVLNNERE